MKNSNFLLTTILFFALSFPFHALAQTQKVTDFRKTFFSGQARPKLHEKTAVTLWKKEMKQDSTGWYTVPSIGLQFTGVPKEELDEFFGEYFHESYDPEYQVQKDTFGQFLIARNGNRTMSVSEISFNHITGNICIGFIFLTAERFEEEYSGHSKGTWCVFDKNLTQLDSIEWNGSYPGGYVLSDKGVWDCPTGTGLRFRPFTEFYGKLDLTDAFIAVKEENDGFYIFDEFNEKTPKVLLDKKKKK
ncbi:MAG: hypothetical protein AAB438_02805 [Patescibacteria group bacterium]